MPPRPRVLYASFDSVPAPKGASTHILQTVRGIAREADVDLLTLPGTLPGEPGTLFPPGVRHLPFQPEGDIFLQRALEFGDAVAQQLVAEEYAAVHVRSIWEGTPALLLQPQRQYRLVYEVNGLPSIELKYHFPGVGANRDLIARLRGQERALLAAAHRIVTPSDTTRKYLRRHGASGDRLQVIPNGVDPDRFTIADRPLPEVPELLYLGTLAPWQGVPFLLEAMRLVLDERPVRLRVVGGGRKEWRKECEHLVRKLQLGEAVSLEPPVAPEEVPHLLAGSDICVAPLTVTDRNVLQGCCPIKILEYMAAGRPIVAARVPPVCEVLTHEETALLYKPDKPRRLAEALLRLLADPPLCRHLAAAGARHVREHYPWQRHNDAITALYRDLLTTATPAPFRIL